MQRFLVLGVGNAQVDILNYLKGNFELHACSFAQEGRGIELCDYFELIDIINIDLLIKYCQTKRMDFVYSVGSDIAMPTISKVSEVLDMPCFTSYQTSLSCNSKNMFREKLKKKWGAVRFQNILSANPELLNLPLPLMVKPNNSQGQRGVSLINSYDELDKAYFAAKKHSRDGSVIVEEYIAGQEISVNTFIHNGTIIFFILSDRISWPGSTSGAIHKHLLPCSLNSNAQENVIKLVKGVIKTLGIDNGPAYFQIKIEGEMPRLIEVTPRLDGCHLWRLIKIATGVDLLGMTIESLTKGKVSPVNATSVSNQWTLEFFCAPPNTIVDINNFSVHPKCFYHEFYYNDGEFVKEINGYMEKCGYQIFRR